MDTGFSVRRARSSDIEQMCDLLSELFSIEADFTPDRGKQALGLALLIDDTSGSKAVFVSERDSEVIGMCTVQTLVSTAEGGAAGLLEDLVVRKDLRGNGVGKALLSEALGYCSGKGISRVQLLRDVDNTMACDFYSGNGWSDTRLICMRKFL